MQTLDSAPTPALLCSILDAASALGISRTSLYAILDAGEIETVRIGKRRLVPLDSIEAYVAALRAEALPGAQVSVP